MILTTVMYGQSKLPTQLWNGIFNKTGLLVVLVALPFMRTVSKETYTLTLYGMNYKEY